MTVQELFPDYDGPAIPRLINSKMNPTIIQPVVTEHHCMQPKQQLHRNVVPLPCVQRKVVFDQRKMKGMINKEYSRYQDLDYE